MIKKLILLLLVVCGGVVTANAAKLYVCIDNVSWWLNDGYQIDIYSWDESNQSDNTGWGNHNYLTEPIYMYGNRWYVYDMPANHDKALVKRSSDSNNAIAQTWDIAVTNDAYVKIRDVASGDENKYEYDYSITPPSWSGLCLRNTIDDNWTAAINNMEIEGDIFRKSFTKEQIGTNAKIWFRLKHIDKIAYDETGSKRDAWYEICATSNDTEMSLPGSTTEVDMSSVENGNTWVITVPSYDYEKIVITAKYINDNGYKWQISADAYISKTLAFVEDTYIGTFGSTANVDFSNVEGLTAKKLKVSAGTIIETNATTLFGGEGALLTAESAGPFSIPVASSASADTDNNDLVAITEKVQLAQEPVTGYTAYVLTNKKADGSEGSLAFYKVNSGGTWCSAGTAYLKVAKVGGAPDYIPFGETTGIENVSHEAVINNQYYTLDGRRVAQPTKGLYIVNGKKVIIK